MNETRKLAQTVVEISEILSGQQKELVSLLASVQAVLGALGESNRGFQKRFQAKYRLSLKSPGEAMQALAESCRQLSEGVATLKEQFGPWEN